MRRRYLVTKAIDGEFATSERSGFILQAKSGDEVTLDPDMAAVVNACHPGALMEMDPKTKTDWES